MKLLLYHWHCILPVLIIAVAMFLMGRKTDKNDKQEVRFDDSEVTERK